MSDTTCEHVRELIPGAVAGRLPADEERLVEHHLSGCPECKAEAELVELLRRSTPPVPEGLSTRIRSRVASDRRPARRPWWGLAAAAVAALALGIGVSSEPEEPTSEDIPVYVAEGATEGLWLADDGMVAGAPALGSLSDEALQQLLDELGSGGSA